MAFMLGRLRSLGRAFLELLQAELAALGSDLRASAGLLRSGVVFLAVGAFFAFWTVGALAYALIELLSFWLPRWGAVLACTGTLALAALVFLWIGKARLRRLESPARTVGRRLESHSDWLATALLPERDRE